ncbi:MAG: SAM-dependent methyltransferase [Chloroflexi bacterium]|nr:SAM-dependent methyltransferase [Chloroflexota bacterium]|tara:strand:- start:1177 stop:1743 length:567 start_codon:yes stop_codon:yes gene_type:complete
MKFFKISLNSLLATGTIAASSKKYSKLIADSAKLSHKKCVVELGPGDGVITKEIIKQISSKTTFFCLEINEKFVFETQKNCPNTTVYHASAIEITKYLKKHDQSKCDCVISGLPWALFEQKKQEEIIDEIYKSLENGGQFLTIAYITGIFFPSGIRFKKLLQEKFGNVKTTKIIWSNFLPAFAYICTK